MCAGCFVHPVKTSLGSFVHGTFCPTFEIKFYKGAKRLGGEQGSGRNDSGANGKVGETTRGAKLLGAKGKVGETTQGQTGKWAKRPRFVRGVAPTRYPLSIHFDSISYQKRLSSQSRKCDKK